MLLSDLVDLVLPRYCVGCGEPGVALCTRCGAGDPVTVALDGLTVTAAAPYEGGLRVALIAYKERGRRDLARPLRALLRTVLPPPGAVLVPVPSTMAARRARGGDHVRRLVHNAVPALELVRDVRDSAGLNVAARAANLTAAMRARPPEQPGRLAVVVDDIVTTGTTVREAARALRSAGWRVDCAAVIAATPRRLPERHGQPRRPPRIHLAVPPGTAPRAGLT